MNKFLKGAVCAGLCLSMFGAFGCKNKSLNPEDRQLNLATGALDGNFNPFFYTSQNDGEMISMTQLAMLTNDEHGKLVCGENQPTVVQSYTATMYDNNNVATVDGSKAVKTEYEFVIKNGVKFSDGSDLTIADVLFNFYVYLDPAYTGSATMYSTDIRGLKAYRTQDPNAADSTDTSDENSEYYDKANVKINDLIYWSDEDDGDLSKLTEDMKKDYDTVVKLFREEAASDWTSVSGSWQNSFKDTYRFTEAWQAYFFQEGLVTEQVRKVGNVEERLFEDTNGNGERDDKELYYTTLDPNVAGATGGVVGEVVAQHLINEVAAASTEAKIDEYLSRDGNGSLTREYAKEQLIKDYAVDKVVKNYTIGKGAIAKVLQYWATASNALEEFAAQARTDAFEKLVNENNGQLKVKSISGITTDKKDGHDVLKIVINGVDPKAIYNFSIPIAPLSYYSGTFEGVDYVAEARKGNGFGVRFNNNKFFKEVLQDSSKNGLPVGAGVYRCTNSDDKGEVTRRNFFLNNVCYFARNDYFTTVGSGINNAKIKYVSYKVYGDDNIMQALKTKEIDFGKPNATYTNRNEVTNEKHLEERHYQAGGYGYVGINPKAVPEYQVRQAIMKAMDTKMAIGYYTTELAESINRPMSRTSWAYPNDAAQWEDAKFETDTSKLDALVKEAGYVKEGGVYVKRTKIRGQGNAPIGKKLKFTFTIAGETTDHPAYTMFMRARTILNPLGFDITVQTDLQALKKMTSGNLEVWAAAWSSATDPDMYQVYHRDSKATSVNNWNYKNILNNSGEWTYEYNIIEKLSKRIEDGRNVIDEDVRIPIYADCLDYVMELAVELPVYQRNDMCVYNSKVIKGSSLVQSPSHYVGLFDRMWEIDYV